MPVNNMPGGGARSRSAVNRGKYGGNKDTKKQRPTRRSGRK